MAWGAIIQGALAAYQLSQAEKQKSQGASMMAANRRPKMTTPDEMKRNLSIAMQAKDRAAIMGMPGDNVTAERIQQGTQNNFNNMINTGQSSEGIIAGLSSLDVNEKNAFVDLGTRGAEYKLNNENNADATLMNANSAIANQKLNEFDYNENQPYQANAAAGSALVGAGNQNENTALTNLGNATAAGIASIPKKEHEYNDVTPAVSIPTGQIPNPTPERNVIAPQKTGYNEPVNNNNPALLTAIMKRYPTASVQQLRLLYPDLFKA
jgi:hypothetical protein